MKKIISILLTGLLVTTAFSGCGKTEEKAENSNSSAASSNPIVLTDEIRELTDGFLAVRHTGDYGFDLFLEQGGASSDAEVVSFLMESGIVDFGNLLLGGNPFGCSTLSVKNAAGDSLFGRNFDWNTCNAMVIQNQPENGYHSISTVNTDFIRVSGISLSALPDEICSP